MALMAGVPKCACVILCNMESDFSLLFAIIAILLCLLATIFALLIYSGLFTTVDIRAGKPPFEELLVAYKFARGPYKNAGTLFTEVTCLVPRLKSIGVYYDDPSEVASSDLRYVVGAIISEGAADEVTSGSNEYETLLTGKGFKLAKFPSVSYALHTVFPFKNTLSIFLAVGRVYPKLSAYMRERNLCAHPMIEVYDEGIIHFVAPLSKQDDFYVPEAKEERKDGETDQEEEDVSRQSGGQKESPDDGRQQRTEAEAEQKRKEASGETSKEGSNGSEEESTGSSFEELDIDH